jgi:hypothetical protein
LIDVAKDRDVKGEPRHERSEGRGRRDAVAA